MGILQVFTLLGALGMFLYGMNLMSSGLQKAAGDRLRSLLSAMTSNPFKGVMTGLGITSVIQSSSATTVMVVSFVNAGLLTLSQAIGVIMGANIGTTVTAWLVSWLGFKADISILAVPMMLLGFLFSNSKKNRRQNIGELIVGFCLLFLGLSFMKESVPDLNETPQVLDFVKAWSGHGFCSVLIFLAFGTAVLFCNNGNHPYYAQYGMDTFQYGMCYGTRREYRYDDYGKYRCGSRKYTGKEGSDVTYDIQCLRCHMGIDILQAVSCSCRRNHPCLRTTKSGG